MSAESHIFVLFKNLDSIFTTPSIQSSQKSWFYANHYAKNKNKLKNKTILQFI